MGEGLTSRERIETVINLKEPDRVPVAPHLWTYTFEGLSTAEMIRNVDKAEETHRSTFKRLGGWDIVLPPLYPGFVPVAFYPHPQNALFFNVRVPGIDASPLAHSIAEVIEDPPLMNEDGYDIIVNEGFIRFLNLKKVGLTTLFNAPYFNSTLKKKIVSILEYWNKKKVALTINHGFIPFEIFSHMRNLKNFLLDLHRNTKCQNRCV